MTIDYFRQYEPIFGGWSIVKEIGRGNNGTVFEIIKKESGKTERSALEAITIPRDKTEWDGFALANGVTEDTIGSYFYSIVETYKKEIDLMARLKGNPHIVNYEESVIIKHGDGKGWDILIRMELLVPLSQYIKEKGDQFGEDDVLRLGKDICIALEACEKCGVLHRDIKPENIYVSDSNDFKLGGFIDACIIDGTTGASTIVGDKEYKAPEIYRGENGYDKKAAIYSLGMTMYRLLNNDRLPFLPAAPNPITFKDKDDAMKRRLKGEKIPRPSWGDQNLSNAVLKACEYDSNNRFDDAHSMMLALCGEIPQPEPPNPPKKKKYNINIECRGKGFVKPNGNIQVSEGKNIKIRICPDEGYDVARLEIDGVNYSSKTHHIFYGVNRDHDVYVCFKKRLIEVNPGGEKNSKSLAIIVTVVLVLVGICVFALCFAYNSISHDADGVTNDSNVNSHAETYLDSGDQMPSGYGDEVRNTRTGKADIINDKVPTKESNSEESVVSGDNVSDTGDITIMEKMAYPVIDCNIRSLPTSNGDIITIAKAGEQIYVKGKVEGKNWYSVILSTGEEGYVYGKYLEIRDAEYSEDASIIKTDSSSNTVESKVDSSLPENEGLQEETTQTEESPKATKYDINAIDYVGPLDQFFGTSIDDAKVALPSFESKYYGNYGKMWDNHWVTVGFWYDSEGIVYHISISQSNPGYSLLGVYCGMDKASAESILSEQGYDFDLQPGMSHWTRSPDGKYEVEVGLNMDNTVLSMSYRML